MKVSNSTIQFRIDIDFDDADVDMVYNEMVSRGVQTAVPSVLCGNKGYKVDKKKLPKTPTEATVDFALHWLAGYVDRNEMCTTSSKWDTDYSKPMIDKVTDEGFEYAGFPENKTELEEIGVKVESWYGLMMGTCHLICEVDADKFTPELVAKSNAIVHTVFKRLVKYHKQPRLSKAA